MLISFKVLLQLQPLLKEVLRDLFANFDYYIECHQNQLNSFSVLDMGSMEKLNFKPNFGPFVPWLKACSISSTVRTRSRVFKAFRFLIWQLDRISKFPHPDGPYEFFSMSRF